MTNPDNKLREILDILLGEWGNSPAFEREQVAKALSAITDLMIEIIGEDEFSKNADTYNFLAVRNELRAELRSLIKGDK